MTGSETSVASIPVLVTGAGGFIGSHLVESLVRAGARVRAFVRYTSTGHHGHLDELAPEVAAEVEIYSGDLADVTKLELQVLEALWQKGACSVREIQETFPEPGETGLHNRANASIASKGRRRSAA